MTAMKGRFSSFAKYASEIAVEPEDDSMTVVFCFIWPLQIA